MTIAQYPAFECNIIFPKEVLASNSLLSATPAAEDNEEPADQRIAGDKTEQKESEPSRKNLGEEDFLFGQGLSFRATKKKGVGKGKAASQPGTKASPTAKKAKAKGSPPAKKTKAVSKPSAQPPTEELPAAGDQKASDSGPATSDDTVTKKRKTKKPRRRAKGPVSKTIEKIVESPAALPGEGPSLTPMAGPSGSGEDAALKITAEEIMQENILWGDPEQSVQDILAKMQQCDAAYVLIGNPAEAEGIVSQSNLKEALSPYLHPPFDKYKRPLDEATLQIKVKWVMSKPVESVERQTTVSVMMEKMCQCGLQVLTVRDQEKGVQGLVTTLDIFSALLKARSDTSASK
jgi:predicted transcriptional regulator